MPAKTARYYPKADRCRTCSKQHADCSRLPFSSMPVLRRDGVDISVKCTQYKPANQLEPQQ